MLLPLCAARRAPSGLRVLSCLSVSALLLSGCAQSPARSLARVWDQMPSVRWSPKDGHADDETPGKAIAAKSRAKSERETGETRISDKASVAKKRMKNTDPFAPLARKEDKGQSSPKDPFLEDEIATARLAKKKAASTTQDGVDAVTVSRREQLKAELADDSRRTAPEETQSAEQARLKLRVESTMERARMHLANDDLAEAHRAAELAQRLTESSGLEFAPDEEQPIELLTDIIARREAEREKAALADASEEAEPTDQESREDVPAENNPATAGQGSSDRAFAFSDDTEFDPYAQRAAVEQDAAEANRIFNTALVVLESPSFEDDIAAVNPPGPSSYPEGDRRTLHLPFVRKSSARSTAVDEIPEPPIDEASAGPEVALLLPVEHEPTESAPLPPVAASGGPILEPSIQDELPADLEKAGDAVEEIKPAGTLPRWLPLTILSLMTAGLCVWLWRHRTLFNA